jgi:hypothetical protein
VRHDRVRAGVEAGVAVLVPRVDAGEVEVGAVRGDEEGGDHRRVPRWMSTRHLVQMRT